MTLSAAPFFHDIADGPDTAAAYWLSADDGLRIRVGLWPAQSAVGTVLLFPGRTEFIEKYGRAARPLVERGYNVLAIDWRGQGCADRITKDDDMLGDVATFADYQHDVTAMITAARDLGLAEPFHLIAHSMGGCIGLRALMNGLAVNSAVFTGPMWGIKLSPVMNVVAWTVSTALNMIGLGRRFAPGTTRNSYLATAPFADNQLTTDPEMWSYMQNQINRYPQTALGGPSVRWINGALREMRALAQMSSPNIPCLTFLGENERIVDPARIYDRMADWPNGTLEIITPGEHEVLMETPEMRARISTSICDFFDKHR